MQKDSLKNKLEELTIEEQRLKRKHENRRFTSEEEGERYRQENKAELERLNQLGIEIRELEWKLMTPAEQKEQKVFEQKIKEKYANE